jgi:hypothetical protein
MKALSNELGAFMMWIVKGRFACYLMIWIEKRAVGGFFSIGIRNENLMLNNRKQGKKKPANRRQG